MACAVLGVDSDTPIDEIKKRARQLLLRHHPDVNPDNPVGSGEQTKSILNAYRIIADYFQSIRRPSPSEGVSNQQQGAIPESLMVFFANGQELAVSVTCIGGVLRAKDVRITYQVNRNYVHYLGYFMHQDKIVSLFSADIFKGPARHIANNIGSSIIILNSIKGTVGVMVDSIKGIESGISHQNEVVVENIFE